MSSDDRQLSDLEVGELVAFADGSLPEARRAHVEARIQRSPELRALVAEQRSVRAALTALDAPAPAALHARVGGESAARQRRTASRRLAWGAGLTAALAAAAAMALLVAGGSEPTVDAAANLADRGPSAAAPARDPSRPGLLAAAVDGVAFPDYGAKFGWVTAGARADELGGRETETVFYTRGNQRVAYTIVSGEVLDWPRNARLRRRGGVELRLLTGNGEAVVSWLRDGRTCVLTGTGVGPDELLELAAWNAGNTARSGRGEGAS